jgi:hypothetical protein
MTAGLELARQCAADGSDLLIAADGAAIERAGPGAGHPAAR